MNFTGMWFRLGAFTNAYVHLEASTEFWVFYMRAILCGCSTTVCSATASGLWAIPTGSTTPTGQP
jgi:hypothetical protein